MTTITRLYLELLSENDVHFIYELLNTDSWIKFIGNRNIHSIKDAASYIQKINNNPDVTYWTVKHNQTHEAIGIITLIKRDYLEHKDIGFAFLPAYTKKGYAFEATKSILHYLQTLKTIPHILAVTSPGNASSINLLEKLGFQFEKAMPVENETVNIYGFSLHP